MAKTVTMENKMRELLAKNGLGPEQAVDDVMTATKARLAKDVSDRVWKGDCSAYPKGTMIPVLWLAARHEALAWIDANCPAAWYRPMFADVKAEERKAKKQEQAKPAAKTKTPAKKAAAKGA